MSQVVLELLNTKPIEKHTLATHILKSMAGNLDYPFPNPTLVELQAGADNLKKEILAVAKAKAALKMAVDRQKKASDDLVLLLQRESWYVESASGGDKDKIIGAGMKSKRDKSYMQRPPMVQNYRASANRKPGEIMLRWKRMLKSLNIQFYQFRYKLDKVEGGEWTTYDDMTTKSKLLFISPVPGRKIWIQVRAKNSAGFGPWSNPIGIISYEED
ncbi:MAG: fibronectin type III domain-containing protein [Bacteroidetes bacterium]|nr:fibronectin type III domain-containing protein [Bacteroidota bacterium]